MAKATTGRKGLAGRRAARKAATKATKTAKLGAGTRFAAVKKSVAAGLKSSQIRPGQTRAQAAAGIAAAAGRAAHGRRRMAKIAAAGRKNKG